MTLSSKRKREKKGEETAQIINPCTTTVNMATQPPPHPPKKPTSARYPELLIKAPLSGTHLQTIILMHGRGSTAMKFGPELLATSIPDFINLAHAFPCAKFIFPTASKRRARIYKRTPIHQWFDNWSLETPEKWQEFQNEGLRETSGLIHGLLEKEVKVVGARNVVLGGLSQGCAASLVAMLLWQGEALAAGVGMCGWLPYRKMMEDIVREEEGEGTVSGDGDEGDDIIFQRGSDDEDDEIVLAAKWRDKGRKSDDVGDHTEATAAKPTAETSSTIKAIDFLRQEIDFTRTAGDEADPRPASLKLQKTPIFLGHGTEDEKVSVHLGRSAASCLEAMNVDVQWKKYPGLGHWYSGDMLRDMIIFLRAHTGWEFQEQGKDEAVIR